MREEGETLLPALIVAAVGVSALFLPFFAVAPNRIVPGIPWRIYQGEPGVFAALLAVLLIHGAAPRLFRGGRASYVGLFSATTAVLLALFALTAVSRELGATRPGARLGLDSGFWLLCFASWAGAVVSSGGRRKALAPAAAGAVLLVLLAAYFSGRLDSLAIVKEWKSQPQVFVREGLRHLFLVGAALGFGGATGVLVGVLSPRDGAGRGKAFAFLNLVQTFPSLALFGFLIIPLAYLADRFPALREMGIGGIGPAPALIALSAYAALPVARNVNAGLSAIPAAALDAARGMGMGALQTFFLVELPLALPVAIAGFRTAAVQAVGNAAVAALIGAGGLGVFIFQGLGQFAMDLVLAGTLPLVAMALAADGLFSLLERALTPRGITIARDGGKAP